MYCAKASIALMYHRLMPSSCGPKGLKILLPVVAASAVASSLLTAFQCQLPNPWLLQPALCSTQGRVHYATAGLNIATDVLVAFWIVPEIWKLQMTRERRMIVVTLLLWRFFVCTADVWRIRCAISSTDVTWNFLSWAVLDQILVHLSLNHATLPRINVLLKNMQSGLAAPTVTTDITATHGTRGYGPGYGRNGCSGHLNDSRKSGRNRLRSISASSSQEHLHIAHGTEMSTMVIAGNVESTSSCEKPCPKDQIKIEQTVEIYRY
ncbi:hypothetical protein M011DRAFT_173855 [Sporormia fimetaria CBS 119925]|uniref:Rhodopsin domain-containing protein n=1 Tax=Sporormia fimetaria CBS 119925 TaxID=1340428 RepID=A0A6A6V1N2_9PLEO|nr:hypothetical protein M011DRAFT_173855 [Sporormia fimetaria CBS 119925]